LSDVSIKAERAVYSILDFIGDVGGLMDGLIIIAQTFIGIFVPNLYIAQVISD